MICKFEQICLDRWKEDCSKCQNIIIKRHYYEPLDHLQERKDKIMSEPSLKCEKCGDDTVARKISTEGLCPDCLGSQSTKNKKVEDGRNKKL